MAGIKEGRDKDKEACCTEQRRMETALVDVKKIGMGPEQRFGCDWATHIQLEATIQLGRVVWLPVACLGPADMPAAMARSNGGHSKRE